MMKNYDQSVRINHDPNLPYISDHPHRILIIRGSGSGKTNVLLNLMKQQLPNTGKIYLYAKDPFESKYEPLVNGRENAGIKKLKHPRVFIDYWQTFDNVYENLRDYNPKKKRILIVFDFMIANIESNKKIQSYCCGIVFKRKKTQYFTCFYFAILIQSA